MNVYRSLSPIRAMSFDLDDTLYDNRPVIQRVEREVTAWLHTQHPVSASKPLSWWQQLKKELIQTERQLAHDLTHLRFRQVEQGLIRLGYQDTEAEQAANNTLQEALRLRSDFVVPPKTHRILGMLSKRLPLVAITNGNVDVERIGLDKYFSLVLRAGSDGDAKPHHHMFSKAAEFLELSPSNILHVGDHLLSDVSGAKMSGFQACWFNDQGVILTHHRQAKTLPDIEIQDVEELLALVRC
ncbi:5-amino-6-(5-phospho-D-ribitylamino)uracil phosphatase YigB [Vibrio ostreicida]|uniref:5-amino-6-(5-phospho-D-ribitylamino)uracil phosphatase YigB n=1 Tax=Vibrio ostreicida TaxID=526588 RepID=UPI003B5C5762